MKEGNFFHRVLEAEAETRVPAGPGSGENSALGCRLLFSRWVLTWQRSESSPGPLSSGPSSHS